MDMIIDMRLRPVTENFLKSTTDLIPGYGRVFGFDLPESAKKRSLELCLKEMDAAGINLGVAEARWGLDPYLTEPLVPPEDVVRVVTDYPERFVGAIAINGTQVARALADAEKYVVNGPAHGLSLELDFSFETTPQLPIDGKPLEPLFDYMQEQDIPLFLTGGCLYGSQPPARLHAMMTRFPKLVVIDLHGHVPYVEQIIQVALNHKNLFVCPDMYAIHTHYTRSFIDAANGVLQEQMVFGTAYPFLPMKPAVDIYLGFPFRTLDIRDKIMYKNALRALRMEESSLRRL